jgi:hypothetical protein
MSDMRSFERLAVLPGSPAAAFHARIAAELADGSIPCACPHPATADCLSLPSGTLRCRECDASPADQPDSQPGPCASCGTSGACTWSFWLDKASRVGVVARVCQPCGTAGTAPVTWN